MTSILVVDDEQDLRFLFEQKFRRYMGSQDISFFFAHNGFEALHMLRRDTFDVVITDIQMPGMSGLSLIRRIKAFDDTIQCIVLSAYRDPYNVRCAMNCGAFDFLSKPLDFQEVANVLGRTLKHKHYARGKNQKKVSLWRLFEKDFSLVHPQPANTLRPMVAEKLCDPTYAHQVVVHTLYSSQGMACVVGFSKTDNTSNRYFLLQNHRYLVGILQHVSPHAWDEAVHSLFQTCTHPDRALGVFFLSQSQKPLGRSCPQSAFKLLGVPCNGSSAGYCGSLVWEEKDLTVFF